MRPRYIIHTGGQSPAIHEFPIQATPINGGFEGKDADVACDTYDTADRFCTALNEAYVNGYLDGGADVAVYRPAFPVYVVTYRED